MQYSLNNINTIIFDLGGVILDLDFKASINAFHKIGLQEDILDSNLIYFDDIFDSLQTGAASPAQFRSKIRKILKYSEATDQQIDDAWCAMLAGIPFSRIETILELRKKYKVFLFSNTNIIHIEKLKREFAQDHDMNFESVFDKVYYSQDIHDIKPAVSSFLKVIELSEINPAETLFVDDLEDNIKGAEKAGLKTFWFKKGLDFNKEFKII